ncbi:MAG: type II toxin-antitoxin system VapC family toxin [Lachnospiraceae bacterium]|nr:type II toxin-antitoxin system VapC family toxin [Lachnospiraceae bacterium]
MRLLLDTHIALWAISDSKRLNEAVRELLENEANAVYYSMVSVWEVAIKRKIHPEQMPMDEEVFVSLCEEAGLEKLGIRLSHIFTLKELTRQENAPHHNDPFDRLLLAQAKSEGFRFMTHDSLIADYDEPCVMMI